MNIEHTPHGYKIRESLFAVETRISSNAYSSHPTLNSRAARENFGCLGGDELQMESDLSEDLVGVLNQPLGGDIGVLHVLHCAFRGTVTRKYLLVNFLPPMSLLLN